MSDKHTAALDLDKLEVLARAATPGPWIAGDDEDSDLYLVGPAAFDDVVCHPVVRLHAEFNADYIAAANPETVLALIAKIRASEGQAQTSAAAEQLAIARAALEKISTWRFGWDGDSSYAAVANDALTAIDAAQLADSTAPGALSEVERLELELSNQRELTQHWKGRANYVNGPAAPTAQQSLTAGGAVPDDLEIRKKVQEALGLGRDAHASFAWTYLLGCIKAAAAPLPQVQSDALDAAWYVLNKAPSLYALGFNVAHARSCTNGIDETGVGSDEYEAAADDVRGAIRKARDLIRSALAQQAIKPSVDNDGGVA